MGTISEKLDYLKETKTQIKEALVAKHATVSDSDTFRSYADKIKNLPQVDATLVTKEITENGTYTAATDTEQICDGYSEVVVNVRGGDASSTLVSKTFTANGTYKASDDTDLNQTVVTGAYNDSSPVEYSGNLSGAKYSHIILASSGLKNKGTVTIAIQTTSSGDYKTVATIASTDSSWGGSTGRITLNYDCDLTAETPIYGYKITFTDVNKVSCTMTFKSASQVYYGYNVVTVNVTNTTLGVGFIVNPDGAYIIPATLTIHGYDDTSTPTS